MYDPVTVTIVNTTDESESSGIVFSSDLDECESERELIIHHHSSDACRRACATRRVIYNLL